MVDPQEIASPQAIWVSLVSYLSLREVKQMANKKGKKREREKGKEKGLTVIITDFVLFSPVPARTVQYCTP